MGNICMYLGWEATFRFLADIAYQRGRSCFRSYAISLTFFNGLIAVRVKSASWKRNIILIFPSNSQLKSKHKQKLERWLVVWNLRGKKIKTKVLELGLVSNLDVCLPKREKSSHLAVASLNLNLLGGIHRSGTTVISCPISSLAEQRRSWGMCTWHVVWQSRWLRKLLTMPPEL